MHVDCCHFVFYWTAAATDPRGVAKKCVCVCVCVCVYPAARRGLHHRSMSTGTSNTLATHSAPPALVVGAMTNGLSFLTLPSPKSSELELLMCAPGAALSLPCPSIGPAGGAAARCAA